jgi:hypothetical protein
MNQQTEEFGEGELAINRLAVARLKRVKDARQAQLFNREDSSGIGCMAVLIEGWCWSDDRKRPPSVSVVAKASMPASSSWRSSPFSKMLLITLKPGVREVVGP